MTGCQFATLGGKGAVCLFDPHWRPGATHDELQEQDSIAWRAAQCPLAGACEIHVETIGTFEVVSGQETYPQFFARSVPKTALAVVRDDCADLIELLEREHQSNPQRGYKRDPKLGVFTGWALRERRDLDAPEFVQSQLFPGAHHNLWHYPDPRLPFEQEE